MSRLIPLSRALFILLSSIRFVANTLARSTYPRLYQMYDPKCWRKLLEPGTHYAKLMRKCEKEGGTLQIDTDAMRGRANKQVTAAVNKHSPQPPWKYCRSLNSPHLEVDERKGSECGLSGRPD
ncbi:hypothetical protein C8F04DRAFT_313334 [Mycena alexandri]|uniref:Uncharacterized protein n=1 Tax=Mycena alexandri TaxID=1745969 RepID=A0AAD6WT47_9AGAR|nr:hypothetical protein C8F04DRAFT_313334 [Mycena alexandri]